jgi:hypothetical protein
MTRRSPMSRDQLSPTLHLRVRSHGSSWQGSLLLSFVSRSPQEHDAYHPRSTFTHSLSSFLSWVSRAMVVGDARWMVMDFKSCAWLAVLGSAPFTRWLAASPARAPMILPGRVRSSAHTRRSILPYRSHETAIRKQQDLGFCFLKVLEWKLKMNFLHTLN